MMQILIATHGKMASGMKYTAELIVGQMAEITTIDAYVNPEDDIEKEFENYFSAHEKDRVVVFTDLMGGSVNQKLMKYRKPDKVTLITGSNLPALITTMMASENVTDSELLEYIEESRGQLQLVQPEGDAVARESELKKAEPKQPVNYDNSTAHVAALRIDDRLIHGQVALTLALPIGILGLQIKTFLYIFFVGMFAKKFDQLAAEGKEKEIVFLHYGLWAVNWFLYSLVAFFGILFGSDAVSALMEAIPDVVMNGLSVCGGLLPAVGMAMLMKMLWDKKICMFYFLGFILSAYMNLPLIAIAVLGTIVAVSIGMNDYRINQLQAGGYQAVPATGAYDKEEEEFFA